MKLNLGCGFDRREGWLNVDKFAACEPDRLMDLEATPWDLPSDGFDHVLLKHVLEHLGVQFEVFAAVLREIHRVAAPGAQVEIVVPHVRHDKFWADPTHVRAFTPLTFQMLSKSVNRQWIAQGVDVTMLAMLIDVDFEVESVVQAYDPEWSRKVRAGEYTLDQVQEIAHERWNVAQELQVKLRAVK